MSSKMKLAESYAHTSRSIQHKWFRRLLSLLDIRSGSKCLDIGCGPGYNTVQLTDKVGSQGSVTGIDPDEDRINIAKKYHNHENVNYIVGKSTCLPPSNEGYDFIVSNAVMHRIKYDEKIATYENVLRLLKVGGVFASCEPNCFPHNVSTFLPVLPPQLHNSTTQDRICTLLPHIGTKS